MKFKRVLLKLSGEVLAGAQGFGLDFRAIDRMCREIAQVASDGIQIGLVVGGGNFFRGRQAVDEGVERSQADYMGMLGTVINALALQDVLERKNDIPTRVLTAIEMRQVAEPYIRRRALRHMEKGRVVICAAGTGNPYFTTDTTAALRGMELKCDAIIKATKVDGIYDKDPVKCADAVRFDKITYHEVLVRGLQVMDSTATALCQDNRMPILVLNIDGEDTVKRALAGEPVGTLVYQED